MKNSKKLLGIVGLLAAPFVASGMAVALPNVAIVLGILFFNVFNIFAAGVIIVAALAVAAAAGLIGGVHSFVPTLF